MFQEPSLGEGEDENEDEGKDGDLFRMLRWYNPNRAESDCLPELGHNLRGRGVAGGVHGGDGWACGTSTATQGLMFVVVSRSQRRGCGRRAW